MALSRKITKATFDSLKPDIQAEYKVKDDGAYYLDTDDATALENALSTQKAEAQKLKDDLAAVQKTLGEIQTAKDAAEAEKNRKGKDYDALEKSYQDREAKLKADHEAAIGKLNGTLETMLVRDKASELAREIFGDNADIGLPHVLSRLKAELTGDKPTTRVLDAKGEVSAASLDDFKKEMLDNPKFASIVVQSRGTGSDAKGSPGTAGNAGTKAPADRSDAERNQLLKDNPDQFYKDYPHVPRG